MDIFGIFTLPGSQRDSLVLSFQWHPTSNTTIGITLSTGEVMLLRFDGLLSAAELNTKKNGMVQKTSSITGVITSIVKHELEAWTLAFTPSGKSLISGGDDCALRFSTSREQGSETSISSESYAVTWSNRKIHEAGVTAILPLTEDIYLTGSYDDNVRLVDNKSKMLAEQKLGGGVWRLKVIDLPLESGDGVFLVLASCMHAGARVLQVSRDESAVWRIKVLASFSKHRSMNYGSDWRLDRSNKDSTITFVSMSFYDKLVCVWKYEYK
jgi:diphthamide biosynthesis protein 7